jgi:hypothetical protein
MEKVALQGLLQGQVGWEKRRGRKRERLVQKAEYDEKRTKRRAV